MGYLCYIQPSKVLSNSITNSSNNDVVSSLKGTYRVVSIDGCDVHIRNNFSAPVIAHLAQGCHIYIKQRVGHWIEIDQTFISKPSSSSSNSDKSSIPSSINQGWCSLFTGNPNHTPSSPSTVLTYITQLSPLIDLAFNKHGEIRTHGNFISLLLNIIFLYINININI
jgi:hypothetical protein